MGVLLSQALPNESGGEVKRFCYDPFGQQHESAMYGPDGKVVNNFCGYPRSKHVAISERYSQAMFPHYIGLHGFEISQMK